MTLPYQIIKKPLEPTRCVITCRVCKGVYEFQVYGLAVEKCPTLKCPANLVLDTRTSKIS